MPQPLSRIPVKPLVRIGNVGDYPMRLRPELAVLVADSIATWATLESFMLRLFVALMGGSSETAARVFLALEIQSAKSAAIQAVATKKLPTNQQNLLTTILALVKSQQKVQDKLAHWTWGYAPELPDALLLINPKAIIDLHELNFSGIFVYKKWDFEGIIKTNERLTSFAMSFEFIVKNPEHPTAAELYGELCSEPEIQEGLDRLGEQDRSPPEECPQ